MDKIIGEDQVMSIIIEMTLEETILDNCKITEVRILEVDIEEITETITLEEVEVGLRTDNIQVILTKITEVVVLGQAQIQEVVPIETEVDALSVGNMIICYRTNTTNV